MDTFVRPSVRCAELGPVVCQQRSREKLYDHTKRTNKGPIIYREALLLKTALNLSTFDLAELGEVVVEREVEGNV